ncbi:hypothetical protein DIE07_08650 [Burkholderia sp. Bp9002]|nr:hypothetical protein DIE07_08650 [Burkholderia sp. Bp9002]
MSRIGRERGARLLFMTALYVDLDANGRRGRYCFEHRVDAERELDRLQSGIDVPSGFVVQR